MVLGRFGPGGTTVCVWELLCLKLDHFLYFWVLSIINYFALHVSLLAFIGLGIFSSVSFKCVRYSNSCEGCWYVSGDPELMGKVPVGSWLVWFGVFLSLLLTAYGKDRTRAWAAGGSWVVVEALTVVLPGQPC